MKKIVKKIIKPRKAKKLEKNKHKYTSKPMSLALNNKQK